MCWLWLCWVTIWLSTVLVCASCFVSQTKTDRPSRTISSNYQGSAVHVFSGSCLSFRNWSHFLLMTPLLDSHWIQLNRKEMLCFYLMTGLQYQQPTSSVAVIALFSTHSAYHGNANTDRVAAKFAPIIITWQGPTVQSLNRMSHAPSVARFVFRRRKYHAFDSLSFCFCFLFVDCGSEVTMKGSVNIYEAMVRKRETTYIERLAASYSRLIPMKLFSDHGQPHHSQTERIKAQARCLWPEELSLFRIRSALSRRQQSCRSASTAQYNPLRISDFNIRVQYECRMQFDAHCSK